MRRLSLLIASFIAVAGLALPAAAGAAQDTYARNYESQITGLQLTGGISIDPAGHPWVVDSRPHGVIDEYGVFPSLSLIGEQAGGGHFLKDPISGYANAAIDGVNGYLYVADTGESGNIQVYDPTNFIEEWPAPGTENTSWVATDNSGGPSNGRVYVATYNPATFEAFEPGHVPAPFSCGAPCSAYVSGNKITGTPSQPLSYPYDVEVDEHGNIFLLSNQGVNEFKPSGEFVRTFPGGIGIAVDPSDDHLLVFGQATLTEYSPTGEVLAHITEGAPGEALQGSYAFAGMAVNSAGDLYFPNPKTVDVFSPAFIIPKITYQPVTNPGRDSVTLNATADPNGGENVTSCHFEYGTTTAYSLGSVPCTPDPNSSPPGSNFSSATPVSANLSGLTTETTYHYRLVAGNAKGAQHGEDQTYTTPTAVTGLTTGVTTEVLNTSATLHGSFTNEEEIDTEYWFEYGTGTSYTHKTPVVTVPGRGSGASSATENVSAALTGLTPGTNYHFRIVAKNHFGASLGLGSPFGTHQPPSIEGLSSSAVAATTATLNAAINPEEFDTHYSFEYGTTDGYGRSAPVPAGDISTNLGEPHTVSLDLTGLERGATYHFRVIAENEWGEVASEDQTFSFFPPSCPNSIVRQQTGSAYLPDCRAYELVSPGDANATLLYPGGPASATATQPSRLSFVGSYSSLPGTETIETGGDLYVATRGSQGWTSQYIGLPGDQAGCMGGPPTNSRSREGLNDPAQLQNTVLADASMSRFLDWSDGAAVNCSVTPAIFFDTGLGLSPPSNAPYLWNAEGELERRLPSGVGEPGVAEAFACPYEEPHSPSGSCTGETTASPDLRHLLFSSRIHSFSEGSDPPGLTVAPGSAYDEDLETETDRLISRTAAGGNIPQDPVYASLPPILDGSTGTSVEPGGAPGGAEEFLRFPAVSSDGSHVLISTATQRTPSCVRPEEPEVCQRYLDTPLHLYMRVDDSLSYDVSHNEAGEDVAVKFVGMTANGGKVYFTSPQRLTADDTDNSVDLYMWSEATDSLTDVSLGSGGTGNSDSCNSPSWTSGCGVVAYDGYSLSNLSGGAGGNAVSDTALASRNGDIYFYSPEQLDGDRGVLGEENVYDYREGGPQYVTTLEPHPWCGYTGFHGTQEICADGPIARIDVAPDDAHMAFMTTTQLTSYDNAGHLEMYTYEPSTGRLVCVSCRPDGQPATSDAQASEDGYFMTDDGRAFFSTEEPLVPQDTNEGVDVYEYVGGRPQLITPGTGTATVATSSNNVGGGIPNPVAEAEHAGLVSVSADGSDVYFSTFDVLLPEDHNGNFYKFYDARTNGGFPLPPPRQPCEAAEECHGAGSEAPLLPAAGTAATLAGGNVRQHAKARRGKVKHRRHKGRKRGQRRHRGAGR